MGLVKMPTIEHYWSQKLLYKHPFLSSVMTRNRFQLLLRFLHFNNTDLLPAGDPNYDRLFKLRPILDHFHERFQEFYEPRREICVDESLLLWKGRLVFRQYIPLKRARFGIKIYLCCESDGDVRGSGGYCYCFKIYSGREDPLNDIVRALPPDCDDQLSPSEKMTVFMILPLLEKGYHLYLDNWYSRLRLYLYLLEHQTLACGTVSVRVDRGIPAALREQAEPEEGTSSTALSGDDRIVATKFWSTKVVHFFSTAHGHHEQNVPNRRRDGAIRKPAVALAYNRNMGGVDKQDQLLQPYSCARKSMKWTKKLFFHILQMSACNAFICARKDGYRGKFLAFLEEIIMSWIGSNSQRPLQVAQTDDAVRLMERHFPAPIPVSDQKQYPTRICLVCSKKGHKRKESRNHCPDCPTKPALCYPDCYRDYHTKFVYWK